jgi:hypothetical protein
LTAAARHADEESVRKATEAALEEALEEAARPGWPARLDLRF